MEDTVEQVPAAGNKFMQEFMKLICKKMGFKNPIFFNFNIYHFNGQTSKELINSVIQETILLILLFLTLPYH